nr:Chain R, H3 N-terminus [Xenopus laevis]
ARTMQTAR